MEKLKINKFLSIDSLEIDISKINILMGPQSTGKSITLKVLYFIYEKFPSIIEKYFIYGKSDEKLEEYLDKEFSGIFPTKYFTDGYSIEYQSDLYELSIRKSNGNIQFEYDDNIKSLIDKLKDVKKDQINSKKDEDKKSLNESKNITNIQEKIRNIIDVFFKTSYVIYVPSSRLMFPLLQNNIWSLSNVDNFNFDPIIKSFGSRYDLLKNFYNNQEYKSELLLSTVDSSYVKDDDDEYFLHADKRKTNIAYSSAGQQSILPNAIVSEILLKAEFRAGKVIVFFEEPEAHLFPNAQKDLIYYLSKVIYRRFANDTSVQLFLTTHSPYILSSFNNLLLAGKKIKENKENKKKVENIMDGKISIEPNHLKAYFLDKKDKKVVMNNLIDEDGLVDIDKLDSASDKIMEDFNALLEI